MTPAELRKQMRLLVPAHEVVIDIVLRWSETIGKAGTAKVMQSGDTWSLWFACKNHKDQYVSLATAVHFDGEATDGPPPRWVLFKLAPTVWKLAPSVVELEKLHAFITLVGVPDPAPWEKS